MNKRALGRGLHTLLPNRPQLGAGGPIQTAPSAPPSAPTELPIDSIVPNPFQPRKQFDEQSLQELAQSIRTDGVIQPLVVRKAGDAYQLIAGERRWRASKIAGLNMVPVHIQAMPDDRMLEVALVENIQREDLNSIEEAVAFQRLSDDLGLSHEEIGQRTGKDRATISNSIRILQLPGDIQDLVAARKLSAGHARALLKVAEVDQVRHLAQRCIQQGWSVRQLEQCTNLHKSAQPAGLKSAPGSQDPNVKAAIEELERVLGTRVRVVESGRGKGRIEIDYYSGEDLDRIYTMIMAPN